MKDNLFLGVSIQTFLQFLIGNCLYVYISKLNLKDKYSDVLSEEDLKFKNKLPAKIKIIIA